MPLLGFQFRVTIMSKLKLACVVGAKVPQRCLVACRNLVNLVRGHQELTQHVHNIAGEIHGTWDEHAQVMFAVIEDLLSIHEILAVYLDDLISVFLGDMR